MKKNIFALLLILTFFPLKKLYSQWTLDSNGLGNTSVLSLTVVGQNIFAGTLGHGIYLSTNNGSSWAQTSLNTQNFWSMTLSGIKIFAATDNNMGLYASTNNGGNWFQTSLNNQTVWSLAANGTYIFAGTEGNGVFLSTNNGLNWSQTSLNTHSVHSLAINGNNIFAGTFNFGIYVSTNNGTTWNPTSLGAPSIINAITISAGNIFAGTQINGVMISTDNGTSFQQTSLDTQYVRSLTSTGINIFAGVQNGGVFVSNDNGNNWLQRNEGIGNSSVDALYILNGYLLAGTEDGTLNGFYKRPLSDVIGIKPISGHVPKNYSLSQNYPNPFNPATNIRFAVPKSSFVNIIVYDMLGRKIETIVNKQLNAGTYVVNWTADMYSSGVYYCRLTAGDYSETKKMILIK